MMAEVVRCITMADDELLRVFTKLLQQEPRAKPVDEDTPERALR